MVDSAAQLNSMLASPKLHLKIDAPSKGQSIDLGEDLVDPGAELGFGQTTVA